MIEISRTLARSFRAVLKKLSPANRRDPPGVVLVRADRTGLRLVARNSLAVIEYARPGSYATAEVAFPAEALADFEGRKTVPVRVGQELGGYARQVQLAVVDAA